MKNYGILGSLGAVGLVAVVLVGIAFVLSWERPPVTTVQHGYRGTGLVEVYNPRTLAKQIPANQPPEAVPPLEASGTRSAEAYQNIKVLQNVDSSEFLRLMSSITNWVSPEQSCNYCHNPENLADDSVYTKVVARRMLQMVQHINADWKSHVGATGVTCYTCHRGQPVPRYTWTNDPGPKHARGLSEGDVGKNYPARSIEMDALPYDPFTPFLENSNNIRVQSTTALPTGNLQSIKQTEWTYALMLHLSDALGVNCDYCHNSRAFENWQQSTPQRVTAWYGIRMVRDLNATYLDPLKGTLPASRMGPLGDSPKVNCTTCHQGAFKPLYGAQMAPDYPELLANTSAEGGVVPPVPKP